MADSNISLNKLFIGATAVAKIYFGSSEVSKVYVGSTVVYEVSTPTTGDAIEVSGASNTAINGTYNLVDSSATGDNRIWKHSTNTYYISRGTAHLGWYVTSSSTRPTNMSTSGNMYYTTDTSYTDPFASDGSSHTWSNLGGSGTLSVVRQGYTPSLGTITATSPQTFSGTQGTSFVGSLSATSSTGATCIFALKTGYSLPDGLSMGSMGGISGTPTSSGTTSVVMVVSATGCTSIEITVEFTFAAATPVITVTTPVTITGTVGQAINVQLQASVSDGGTPNFIATSLPAGLTCSSTGLISGSVATTFGPSSVMVSVSYSGAETKVITLEITITETPATTDPTVIVSGCSTTACDGTYYLTDTSAEGDARIWKHESQNYYILKTISTGHWLITTQSSRPSYPMAMVTYTSTTGYANPGPDDGTSYVWYNQANMTVIYTTGPTIAVTTPVTVSVAQNESLSHQLIASDNTGATCVFALDASSPAWPTGVTMSNTGLISGIPTVIQSMTARTINVSSNSGATTKQIIFNLMVRDPAAGAPAAIGVTGAGTSDVNRIFDVKTIADETKPTNGDRYCAYSNTTSYYKMEYYESGDTKQWRLFGSTTSQRYYANCTTGYEWPDDPTLVWATNSGATPLPTITATTARTLLSQMTTSRAGTGYYNDITYTSYNQTITGSSPTTTDALWTAFSTGYSNEVFVRVASITGGYVWQIGYQNGSSGVYNVLYQTYNPVADIADLKWPWDRTDWYVSSAGASAPVPLVTNPNGSVTQAVGAYTGKMVIHSAGTTAVNNTYTCDNQSIDDDRPKPYARFTYGNYLCVLTQYNSLNYYRWTIYNVSTSSVQQYYYQSSSTFTESNAVWPWDDSLTWSTNYGSSPVPLFLKGDGSDGGLKYGDYLMEEPTTGTAIRFVYSGSSIGTEPAATDVWTSKNGTKTISWDSTNKWWQYKTGSTVEYHTTAYTSVTPYQFPWEYTDESWVAQGGQSGSSNIVVSGTAADEYGLTGTYTFRSDITLYVMNYQGPASELPNGGCWVMGEGVAAPVIFAYDDGGGTYYYDITDLSSSQIYTTSDPSAELVEPWNATWSDDIVINQA